MLQNKEKKLVQYLLKHKNQYVTSKDMALELECSDRTIRTYLKIIIDEINKLDGVELSSKHGCGYKLNFLDDESYQKLLDDFSLFNNEYSRKTDDIWNREHYILNKLLFSRNDIFFDTLIDELYVSRSTLSNDFKKIRKKLLPYDLYISSKANKGVYIEGSEKNKRKFIVDYFYDKNFLNIFNRYVNGKIFQQEIDFEELTIIILEECSRGNLKISDFVLQNLVVHISLTVRRISEGFCINKLSSDLIHDKVIFEISNRILKRISNLTGIVFPKEEIDYIALHLVSKSYIQTSDDNNIIEIEEKIKTELVTYFTSQSNTVYNNFKMDTNLFEGLVSHLKLLLIRLQNQVTLENPLLLDIKTKYEESFKIASNLVNSLPIFEEFTLSDDEIAYISLHILAAIERCKENNKMNILVICATGFGSAQMLCSRINNELGNLVSVVDVIGYYELNDNKLQNIDAIISTVELGSIVFSIPVFTVSVFLNNEEVLYLKNQLLLLSGVHANTTHKSSSNINFSNIFDRYFSEHNFLVLEECESKYDLIDKMLENLSTDEEEKYIEDMKKYIIKREELSTVVFSDTIAVPHAIKAISQHHKISVAIIRNGVYWDKNHTNIKFVFLPSFSIFGNEGLKEITKRIVKLVDCLTIQKQLIHCNNLKEFKNIFLTIEEDD
ncbi:MAG: PRD domain-containing protein [Streptococcus sp.]|nr:PRD domain-containing protein [Streptococcus sp.]